MRAPRHLLVIFSAVLVLAAGTGTALADPPSGITPTVADDVALVSASSQILCDQFSTDFNAYVEGQPPKFYCWDAVNPTTGAYGQTIETKYDSACTISRPSDSSADFGLLATGTQTTNRLNYCVDMAAVDRKVNTGHTDTVFYARDLITVAEVAGGNGVGATFTDTSPTLPDPRLNNLAAIYECNASLLNPNFGNGPVTWRDIGGTGQYANDWIVPVLPGSPLQGGVSDTAKQFLTDIGVTIPGSCVVNGTSLVDGSTITQNEGTNSMFTSADARYYKDILVPYSAADYACQTTDARCPNVHGNLVLQDISGKPPLTTTTPATANICYPITLPSGGTKSCFPWPYVNDLTMDVRDADGSVPPYQQSLLGNGGPTGWICGTIAQNDIAEYGFATIPTPKPGTTQPWCGKLNWTGP